MPSVLDGLQDIRGLQQALACDDRINTCIALGERSKEVVGMAELKIIVFSSATDAIRQPMAALTSVRDSLDRTPFVSTVVTAPCQFTLSLSPVFQSTMCLPRGYVCQR
eukprot:TRINITY_DN14028_c0_g3_i1.p1 TRINITY_DN14028_c0_g3~~TRINITY_DN14028_c0_g3_i1.p1  ORF type:complete len:108 (+),score=11.83 TRINITY_DN14028_c0_g3_i1:404-727(+)